MPETSRPRDQRPPKLRPIPVTEERFREIEQIPEPELETSLNGVLTEIERNPTMPNEGRKVLSHMLQRLKEHFDKIWKAIEILNRRVTAVVEAEEQRAIDLTFTEIARQNSRTVRSIETDDGEFRVTVQDTIAERIDLQNADGETLTLIFAGT